MGTKTFTGMNNISFKNLTTFKTGGKIKYYFEVPTENDLIEKISFAKKNKHQIFIIGGGSDILVSDDELSFHPGSHGQKVLTLYKQRIL